jgi:hypothetical protein
MAIWQYTIELIPKNALLKIECSGLITLDGYDNFPFWENNNLEIPFFEALTAQMKPGTSWSDEIILFGDGESTCIRFFMEENKISGIDVRIDFRYNSLEILNSVIEFCKLNAFLILDNLEILDLNAAFIIQHIKNSKQLITYERLFEDRL